METLMQKTSTLKWIKGGLSHFVLKDTQDYDQVSVRILRSAYNNQMLLSSKPARTGSVVRIVGAFTQMNIAKNTALGSFFSIYVKQFIISLI